MAFQLISAREAQKLMKFSDYVVIDMRNHGEYDRGHIAGGNQFALSISGSIYREASGKQTLYSLLQSWFRQHDRREKDVRCRPGCFKYRWWNFIIQRTLICIKGKNSEITQGVSCL